MSKTITKPASAVKKTVKINENDLVELIDNIVTEAVAVKKQEWLNEQEAKKADKTAILESRIAALESKLTPAPKAEAKK